jgi:hypothetical protein
MLLPIAIRGAEMWTLRKIEEICVENFETWCWRNLIGREQKISWTDTVKDGVLQRFKVDGNIQHEIKPRESNWTGHILRRNCHLKHVTAGKIGAMRGSGKGHGQRLDDCKEKRRHKLKEEALDHVLENWLWKSLWTCGKTDKILKS